jgi:hypothetical protein
MMHAHDNLAELLKRHPARITGIDISTEEKEDYERLKEKNSNPPLFFIVKATKI